MADDPALLHQRVSLHRAVWHPSRITLEAYRRLRAAPTYDPRLDVVVTDLAGAFVAYALGWFDAVTGQGIMEPVGTHPEHRGRGLGRAAVQEVTRRLAERGAGCIMIRTPETNVSACALYTSAGYLRAGALHNYARPEALS
ncbi:GNAT family N-acetyltransferase [Deinococcus hohokamensis]|uniref:GNAT family N-acetyltransferase n=1 Tax=Deinococcus hohokamensis TaxID=309883 RepID=A0ABV9IC29_9DEIO